jgi:predicted Zn-dependent peptidase
MIIAAAVAMALSLSAPTVRVLDNGTTVFVQAMPGAKTYSAQLFVRAGSTYQKAGEEGVFHLIEHLVFRSSDAQYRAELTGSWMNATTYREFTRYVVMGPSESWKDGLKCLVRLATSVRDVSFESLNTESRVVIEEIALQDLDHEADMDRALWKVVFPSSAWAMRTSGEPASIARMGRSELESAIAKHYTGTNIVIVVAGDVQTEEALEVCEELSRFPRGDHANLPTIPAANAGRSVAKSPAGVARVGLGFVAPGIHDANYAAFRVAIEALAGRYGLLTDAGLRTSVFFGPSEKGWLATFVLSGNDQPEEIERTAMQTLRAAATSLTDLHFSSAKAIVLSEIRAASRAPEKAAFRLGLGAIFGKPDFFASEAETTENVTIESVKQVLETLTPENATVIVWSKS